jgi:hypothetical protein
MEYFMQFSGFVKGNTIPVDGYEQERVQKRGAPLACLRHEVLSKDILIGFERVSHYNQDIFP